MKRAVESKSIWFYTLSIIVTVGTALLADENFKDLLGDNIGYVTGLMAVVGIGLRLVTTRPIGKENLKVLEVDENQSDDTYGINNTL